MARTLAWISGVRTWGKPVRRVGGDARVSLFLNRGERENLDRRVPKLENVAYFNNSKAN